MKAQEGRKFSAIRLSLAGVVIFGCLGLVVAETGSSSAPAKPNRYIGAAKCKNCHGAAESGDQFGAWEHAKHSTAFDSLGSDEAKQLGAKLGIAEPQKSENCLKCHTTAFGEPAEMIKRGFDVTKGVQCESCHGPGEAHMKARFAAASAEDEEEGFGDEAPSYAVLPEGEIVINPPQATCRGCHNDEGPTFERFCYYESVAKVRHINPLKPRSKEALAAILVCGCGDACGCVESCPDDGCGVPPSAKEGK